MRLGQPPLALDEGADADLGLFERALEEQDAMQCSARFLGRQVGVMLGLLLPDAAELVIDVAALRIEIIALAVAIQPNAHPVWPVVERAGRSGARLRPRLAGRPGADRDVPG